MIEREAVLGHGRLRYVEAGTGPVLLLVHGLGGSWRNWERNLHQLAQEHRVIAVDLPGFGGSDRLADEPTMERYADVLVELLDHVGAGRATFVGNSLGGLLTIDAAARHPDRVAGAVLVCAGAVPLTGRRYDVIVTVLVLLSTCLRHGRVRRLALSTGPLRRALAAGLLHDARAVEDRHVVEALDGVLSSSEVARVFRAARRHDARPQAAEMRCPTLVLWGREDRLLPLWMGEELHDRIADAELVVWDRTGHVPMLERPARFNELLARFVAGRTAGEPLPSGG